MSNGAEMEQPGPAGEATSGRLGAGAVAGLVRLFEPGRRSGTLRLVCEGDRTATLWFRDGRLVDCEAGRRSGEAAFYEVLGWGDGTWSAWFGPVGRARAIALGAQALMAEGARRSEELARVAPRLPPRDLPLEIDFRLLSARLAEIPDDLNGLLKLVDGRRSLREVLEEAGADELAGADALARLHAEGIVRAAAAAPPALATAVDWFAGPHGGEAPPAGEPAADGVPRIVRFPARSRGASPTPAVPMEALAALPAEHRLPAEPPVEPEDPLPAAAVPAVDPAVGGAEPRVVGVAAAIVVLGSLVAVWRAGGAGELRGVPVAPPASRPAEARSAALPGPAAEARLLASAQRQYLAGNFLGAVRDYQAALALRETGAARFGLGRALCGAGQPALAIEALQRAVGLDGPSAEVYMALGEAYLADHRWDEARRAFRWYLELAPAGEQAGDVRAALARLK